MKGFVIGLTGGIGSGKSVAADEFAAQGAALIDADAIAHELTGPAGAAMPAIERAFGSSVVTQDGALDRVAMRKWVFADTARRQELEAILHPMIRHLSETRQRQALSAGAPYAVMVIPLLVESKLPRERFDRIAVVDCPEEMQVSRVMARNGLDRAEVEAIMATQASRSARLAAADDVIGNDGDLRHLHEQVVALHVKYAAMAEKIRSEG